MKYLIVLISFLAISCQGQNGRIKQSDLTNQKMKDYEFLQGMYSDPYFPKVCVDKVKTVLVNLCQKIESNAPKTLGELYKITHASTELINDLQEDFDAHGSEIETGAREVIAMDFEYIASAYGFEDAGVEELIATRDW